MQVIILDPLTFVIFIPSGFCILGITNLTFSSSSFYACRETKKIVVF